MSLMQKELLKKGLPPLPAGISLPSGSRGGGKGKGHGRRDYSPLPWSDFFERSQDVTTSGNNCFRVYSSGTSGPVVLLLHGGGHSALSWATFTVALSKSVYCQVVAMDIRGHGDTRTEDDGDLSVDTLISDVEGVVEMLFENTDSAPPIILMGHSMGGAIAVRTAAKNGLPSLAGLVVIDVVEGTAMQSLVGMQGFLRGRPKQFPSLENAIEWSIRSGQLRNVQSARVSMPGQVTSEKSSSLDASTDKKTVSVDSSPPPPAPYTPTDVSQSAISEENENDTTSVEATTGSGGHFQVPQLKPHSDVYKWRIDLTKTECYWKEWFSGLSNLFLSTAVPKLLILAGVDRLDKELQIGQMQGKFQMCVLSGCGHVVHEDAPEKVAEIVSLFLVRYKFTSYLMTVASQDTH